MTSFLGFCTRQKVIQGLEVEPLSAKEVSTEEMIVYGIGRQLALSGTNGRYQETQAREETANRLNGLIMYYNSEQRFEEAERYAEAALALMRGNTVRAAHVKINYLVAETMMGSRLASCSTEGFDAKLQEIFETLLLIIDFHWGLNHPVVISAYAEMAKILYGAGQRSAGQVYLTRALDVSFKILGPNHLESCMLLVKVSICL